MNLIRLVGYEHIVFIINLSKIEKKGGGVTYFYFYAFPTDTIFFIIRSIIKILSILYTNRSFFLIFLVFHQT